MIDYAFHMIIADPTEATLRDHVPKLVKAGHATIKVFMTYDRIKLDDMQLLDVLQAARDNRALVCVHAENHAMISWTGKRLVANGYRAPRYHGVSHPRGGETEAFNRIIALAAFIDQPIMIFHVSTAEGAARITAGARARGSRSSPRPARNISSSPRAISTVPGSKARNGSAARRCATPSDQEALWRALALGDLQTVSSDHAPYRFDATGKFVNGADPDFKAIPNGMPGVEARLPLLFDAMVSAGPAGPGEIRVAHRDRARENLRAASEARARSSSAPMPTSRSGTPSAR